MLETDCIVLKQGAAFRDASAYLSDDLVLTPVARTN